MFRRRDGRTAQVDGYPAPVSSNQPLIQGGGGGGEARRIGGYRIQVKIAGLLYGSNGSNVASQLQRQRSKLVRSTVALYICFAGNILTI